jgi:hypothetical protein
MIFIRRRSDMSDGLPIDGGGEISGLPQVLIQPSAVPIAILYKRRWI